jgi:hypothetical protein
MGDVGAPSVVAGPIASASLLDGEYHKISFLWTDDGLTAQILVDDVVEGAGALVGAVTAVGLTLFTVLLNNDASAITGHNFDGWLDSLEFGQSTGCGRFDLENFQRTPVQDMESLALGATLTGTIDDVTWAGWPFGPPPPFYIDDFRVVNDFSASGSQSLRSDLSAASQPPLTDPVFYNLLSSADYPGNTSGRNDLELRLRLDPSFPGGSFPNGWVTYCPIISFSDPTFTGFQVIGGLIYGNNAVDPDSGNPFDGFGLFINEATADQIYDPENGTIISIPDSYILDGGFHFLRMYIRSDTRTGVIELDHGVYRVEVDLSPFFTKAQMELPGFMLMGSGMSGEPVGDPFAPFAMPNFWVDDIILNGTFARINDFQASVFSEGDEHLYAQRLREPGKALDISIADETLVCQQGLGPVNQIQELENTFFDMLDLTGLDTAEGTQLDNLGTIIGLTRAVNQTDDIYRALLRVQIISNLSNGEAERIITIIKAFTNSTDVVLQEFFPGHMQIEFDGTVPNVSELLEAADNAAAGGVSLILTQINDNPFVFDGDPDGQGFDQGEFVGTVM